MILGYDIAGQPLRAGDDIVIVSAKARKDLQGSRAKVVGPWPGRPDHILIDIPSAYGGWMGGRPEDLRKLNDGDRPADESFDDIMKKYTEKETA